MSDTDRISVLLTTFDEALASAKRMLVIAANAGATLGGLAEIVVFASRVPEAEYAVTLWASAQQLRTVDDVHDFERMTIRTIQVYLNDRPLIRVQWPGIPKPVVGSGAWSPSVDDAFDRSEVQP